MSHFFVHDGQYLLRTGFAPDGQEELQRQPGEHLVVGSINSGPVPFPGARFDVQQLRWVDRRSDDERRRDAANQVLSARRAEYPSIGDQLDVLWKALGPTLQHPEALAMLERIADVKRKHPISQQT